MNFVEILDTLDKTGNLRKLPAERREENLIDFSTNDYLGFGSLTLNDFMVSHPELCQTPLTSSASRLLAATQKEYSHLENCLRSLYNREALLFNSGYHVNTGIISAICDRSTLILADRLVHASIIDGIILSRAKLIRFKHNDINELQRLLEDNYTKTSRIVVIVESVYSMDGDSPDFEHLIELKKRFPQIILYVDEAHAFGVEGPHGLGMIAASTQPESFDIVVATLGKALASYGAFAIVDENLKNFLINKSRSLIFSTALPPLQAVWSELMINRMIHADNERMLLKEHSKMLYRILSESGHTPTSSSHIQGMIVGDATKALEQSARLREQNFVVLPIRTPTVPAGTERLRFSLSAAMHPNDILKLSEALK